MTVSYKDVFEQTYENYCLKLYRLCFMYLKNTQDAEDAVQETFIKRLYNAPVFKSVEHEKRWMYRVAINICRDQLRNKRRAELPLDFAENISIANLQQELLGDIFTVPEKYRLVLHMHYFEGFGVKEISRILGISVSAVKMRLNRGRAMLRAEWGNNE